MGKGNWKCNVSKSTSDNTDTSIKITAKCIWDSNDYSYNINYVTGYVYINGTEYKVFDNGSVSCSSNNTKTLGSKTVAINKKKNESQSIPVYAKIVSKSTYSSGTKTSSTSNVSVSAKTSYTISYNANGGSGAPGSQTKYYGENLTLSSTEPSRTGYKFNGWNTNSSGTGTNYSKSGTYSANAGATLYAKWTPITYYIKFNGNGNTGGSMSNLTMTYNTAKNLTSNGFSKTGYTFAGWATSASGSVVYSNAQSVKNLTTKSGDTYPLYAKWTANKYTISYNANGGSGAPGSQTKTYGSNLVLSSNIPTLTNYNFKGWSYTFNGTTKTIQPGGTFSDAITSNITLTAIWELAYVKPRITFSECYRCDTAGTADDDGIFVKVKFDWATDLAVSSVKVCWYNKDSSSTINQHEVSASGTSATNVEYIIDNSGIASTESSYYIYIIVEDSNGSTTSSKKVISSAAYPIDIKSGGVGIAFGGVAKTPGYLDSYWTTRIINHGIILENNVADTNTFFTSKNTTSGHTLSFGVGANNINRGIWDNNFNKWLFYADTTNLYLQSNNIIQCNNAVVTTTSFRIPKNSTAGYGLTNTDGKSIIRDHGNNNVTVDATGGTLFLAYQNTTLLNIFNGNAYIHSDGSIYPGANSNGGVYFDKWGNIVTKANQTSGNWHIQNNGKNIMQLSWDSGYVAFSGGMRVDASLTVKESLYNDSASIRSQYIYNHETVTSAPNFYITSNGWFRRTTNTSLFSHKIDIKLVEDDILNPERLYNLDIKQFKYKKEYQPSEYDIRYNENLIGFIAEDVEKIYPIAADYEYDIDKDPDEEINKKEIKRTLINWNERYLIPPMLKLIQNHKKEIDKLKVKMAALEQRLAALESKEGN